VLAILWEGFIGIKTPTLFALGFIFLFTVGGVTGVELATAISIFEFVNPVPLNYAEWSSLPSTNFDFVTRNPESLTSVTVHRI